MEVRLLTIERIKINQKLEVEELEMGKQTSYNILQRSKGLFR